MQSASRDNGMEVLEREAVRQLDRPAGIRVDGCEQHPEQWEQEEDSKSDERAVGRDRSSRDAAVMNLDQFRLVNRGRRHTSVLEARTNTSENSAPITTRTSEIAV